MPRPYQLEGVDGNSAILHNLTLRTEGVLPPANTQLQTQPTTSNIRDVGQHRTRGGPRHQVMHGFLKRSTPYYDALVAQPTLEIKVTVGFKRQVNSAITVTRADGKFISGSGQLDLRRGKHTPYKHPARTNDKRHSEKKTNKDVILLTSPSGTIAATNIMHLETCPP